MAIDAPSLPHAEPALAASIEPSAASPKRVGSIDAFRGLVMLLLMAEKLELRDVAKALPGSKFWAFLALHQSHSEWIGCTLHDLIQPSFTFLVGVALPFSLARRASAGQPAWRRTLHAFWRAAVLVLLGVFLRSMYRPQTYWTFEDTLSQIGLGYGFLYILANRSKLVQWLALAAILIGYWATFALYPLPKSDFDWHAVKAVDSQVQLSGFAGHWSKNSNPAWAFDTWFLNLFPRESEFTHNDGGYATLSFIPTLATMILGLLAGQVLLSGRGAWAKVRWLLIAGALCLASGWLLGELGICPVVKRIWTPSWVLYSGGWCFLLLAGFYAVIDGGDWRGWAFPLVVIGMNSIAAYMMAHLLPSFIADALPRHLGVAPFRYFGPEYEPLLLGIGVLIVEWLILFWMYRRKILLRI